MITWVMLRTSPEANSDPENMLIKCVIWKIFGNQCSLSQDTALPYTLILKGDTVRRGTRRAISFYPWNGILWVGFKLLLSLKHKNADIKPRNPIHYIRDPSWYHTDPSLLAIVNVWEYLAVDMNKLNGASTLVSLVLENRLFWGQTCWCAGVISSWGSGGGVFGDIQGTRGFKGTTLRQVKQVLWLRSSVSRSTAYFTII